MTALAVRLPAISEVDSADHKLGSLMSDLDVFKSDAETFVERKSSASRGRACGDWGLCAGRRRFWLREGVVPSRLEVAIYEAHQTSDKEEPRHEVPPPRYVLNHVEDEESNPDKHERRQREGGCPTIGGLWTVNSLQLAIDVLLQ